MKLGRFKLFEKFVVGEGDETYLVRWRLIETPWFGVFLHKICREDHDRHLHDHPWPFVSIMLRGGYVEELPCPEGGTRGVRRKLLSVMFHRATDLHRISLVNPYEAGKPAWTLVLIGPRCREWGFLTETGWVPWETYLKRAAQRPDQCPSCGHIGFHYESLGFYQCRETGCGHSWFDGSRQCQRSVVDLRHLSGAEVEGTQP